MYRNVGSIDVDCPFFFRGFATLIRSQGTFGSRDFESNIWYGDASGL